MVEDTLKTIGTSTGTLVVNIWNLVPEVLVMSLIILNIIYLYIKIKQIKKERKCLQTREW